MTEPAMIPKGFDFDAFIEAEIAKVEALRTVLPYPPAPSSRRRLAARLHEARYRVVEAWRMLRGRHYCD